MEGVEHGMARVRMPDGSVMQIPENQVCLASSAYYHNDRMFSLVIECVPLL